MRDDAIEIKTYIPEFSSSEEAQKYANAIEKLSFQELNERIICHSKLTKDFRHFHLIRFEPYDEIESPDLQNVPFLLSKRANMNRYSEGQFYEVYNL